VKAALLFDHFGPYHQARLGAAALLMKVEGVEFASRSVDYDWHPARLRPLPLISVAEREETRGQSFGRRLGEVLGQIQPDVVAIPGWSSAGAITAMQWCLQKRVPMILMSESCAHDEVRVSWKEWIKRRLVRYSSSALVGGTLHAAYLQELGMPSDNIFPGYDAVDNAHFNGGECPRQESEPAFLASARFIPKKNLPRLLQAYALYRENCLSEMRQPWRLVLLGDGIMRPELEDLASQLQLQNGLELPGFKQYHELPAYYQRAKVFIHASTTEQWGLVVNEAMASSLPVLVSDLCGCAPDLVQNGVNGYTFDPFDVKALSALMSHMADMTDEQRAEMGRAGLKIIGDWSPQKFAQGFRSAAEKAVQVGPCAAGAIDRALLKLLSLR
jgi:1,2-diacylglycerol 3-alpha-glucosyltransferase